MSANLDQVLVKEFEAEAIQVFQEGGDSLRETVQVRDATGAQQVQFQTYGQAIANEKGAPGTNIPIQDPSLTPKVATVKNYVVQVPVDIFLNNQIKFDAVQSAAAGIAMALNRRLDEIIIDTLQTTSTTAIAHGSDNLNVGHLASAARVLGSKVPDQDRHFLCHDNGFYHFVQEANVSSADYNKFMSLVDGDIPKYLGFAIHKINDRDSVSLGDGLGGLALATTTRTNLAWQKQAVGLALNMTPEISIDWDARSQSWLATGKLSAGGVIIQNEGVVPVQTSEA